MWLLWSEVEEQQYHRKKHHWFLHIIQPEDIQSMDGKCFAWYFQNYLSFTEYIYAMMIID